MARGGENRRRWRRQISPRCECVLSATFGASFRPTLAPDFEAVLSGADPRNQFPRQMSVQHRESWAGVPRQSSRQRDALRELSVASELPVLQSTADSAVCNWRVVAWGSGRGLGGHLWGPSAEGAGARSPTGSRPDLGRNSGLKERGFGANTGATHDIMMRRSGLMSF